MGAGLCPTGNGEYSKEGKRQANSMCGECEAAANNRERRGREREMVSVGVEAGARAS